MLPFQSPINIAPPPTEGPYRGRWLIVMNTGEIVSDYVTEAQAKAELPSIRKYARERRAALKEQDRPLRWRR
jgi:hypothetical protein